MATATAEKSTLCIGSRIFYNGHYGVIVGEDHKAWVCLLEGEFASAFGINKKDVQPLASAVFEVGQRVRSGYTFRGVVTGFELDTNKVVCVSEKIGQYTDRKEPGDGGRVRYAYEIDKIFPVETHLDLKQNNVYRIEHKVKGSIMVRALECTYDSDRFELYARGSGTWIGSVPKRVELEKLYGAVTFPDIY